MNYTLKRKSKKSKKGFTLIELVVVIAILGILAAILVPVISGFIRTANEAVDNASARLVYQASAMWYAANNTASTGLDFDDIGTYLGGTALPLAKSDTFGAPAGVWVITVSSIGQPSVSLNGHAYVPQTAKLTP